MPSLNEIFFNAVRAIGCAEERSKRRPDVETVSAIVISSDIESFGAIWLTPIAPYNNFDKLHNMCPCHTIVR